MADDLVKVHVTTDDEGNVTGWCNKELFDANGVVTAEVIIPEGAFEISTSPELIGDLDAVKIINGVAFLDEERRNQAIEEANKADPRDAAILELSDLVALLYGKLEALEK
ncbi:hypothetical protein HB825_03670 [Listeria booriae]|uniref:hypothetical protein n=1 Tax=Listeria booriae TaxID=1552123 RepID=UPI00164EB986|nr:hypothetical protein [Listeria booriae]MBC6133930.1 hypothetical protein [Listeria booriae]